MVVQNALDAFEIREYVTEEDKQNRQEIMRLARKMYLNKLQEQSQTQSQQKIQLKSQTSSLMTSTKQKSLYNQHLNNFHCI